MPPERKRRTASLAFLALLALPALPAPAAEASWDDPRKPQAFKLLQDAGKGRDVAIERGGQVLRMGSLAQALEKARDGDVIRLGPGRFELKGKFKPKDSDFLERREAYVEKGVLKEPHAFARIEADGLLVVGAGGARTWIGDDGDYVWTAPST